MTAMTFTLDRTDSRVTTPARPSAPIRPGRRVGQGTGPQARPSRPLRTPRTVGRVTARGCSLPVESAHAGSTWRLTDRGIAAVLVVAMMIMVAALAVVGLTALQVTSDGYVAHSQSQLTLQ